MRNRRVCNHRQLCLKKAVIDDNKLLEWYVVSTVIEKEFPPKARL